MPQPAPLESVTTRAVLKDLKARGAWAFKVHGGPTQKSGIPDIIGCYHGFFFAIEMKRPGNKATPLQEHTMAEIVNAGGSTTVAFSRDDAMALLDFMDGLKLDWTTVLGARVVHGEPV